MDAPVCAARLVLLNISNPRSRHRTEQGSRYGLIRGRTGYHPSKTATNPSARGPHPKQSSRQNQESVELDFAAVPERRCKRPGQKSSSERPDNTGENHESAYRLPSNPSTPTNARAPPRHTSAGRAGEPSQAIQPAGDSGSIAVIKERSDRKTTPPRETTPGHSNAARCRATMPASEPDEAGYREHCKSPKSGPSKCSNSQTSVNTAEKSLR